MEVISLDQARHFLREKPIRTNLIDRPRLTCELVCMEPQQQDSRQSYDVSDNLYVVLEGACVVRTTASEFSLGQHDALVVPPGVEHWITNPGPERLTVMAFVAPKPARASEVRFPRQQRDFDRPQRDFDRQPRREFRPRRDFEPAPAADDETDLISEDEEISALLGELEGEDEVSEGERPAPSEPRERSFPERGAARREFEPRERRDFGDGRREFRGGHESRGPRRDFSPRPFNDRPAYGRPPRREFGDRPGYSGGGRGGGGRSSFGEQRGPRPHGDQQQRGPRPFGNRPPPRRNFDNNEQGDDRGNRRAPVSRDFYPKKPNQTGGNKEFSPRPTSRGGYGGGPSRGGRPTGGAPRGARPGGRPTGGGSSRSTGRGTGPGASRGGGSPRPTNRPNRPPANRSGRPGPGRSGPRT